MRMAASEDYLLGEILDMTDIDHHNLEWRKEGSFLLKYLVSYVIIIKQALLIRYFDVVLLLPQYLKEFSTCRTIFGLYV